MRTKTLLIAAAALAAGVISSQAQPVYSANIVGYVNESLPKGYNSVNVPLDLAGGNALTNILQNPVNQVSGAGPYDGTTVYIWNGNGYTIYTLDSSWSTGVGNGDDTKQAVPPVINPGTLYYFNNNSGVAVTNTLVGTVHADGAPTGTLIAGLNTNNLPLGYTFVASKLPVAGGITTVLGLTNAVNAITGSGPLDGATVYFPIISANGSFTGYQIFTFDSSWSTGFGNGDDTKQAAEPQVPVGGGFIFNNNTGVALKWVQSL